MDKDTKKMFIACISVVIVVMTIVIAVSTRDIIKNYNELEMIRVATENGCHQQQLTNGTVIWTKELK